MLTQTSVLLIIVFITEKSVKKSLNVGFEQQNNQNQLCITVTDLAGYKNCQGPLNTMGVNTCALTE